MKKIISIILLLSMALTFTACSSAEPKELTCEELIAAYKDAGYSVLYHGHENDECYNDLGEYCCFEIRDPNNEDNYMYVTRYFNVEDAKTACKERQWNPVMWLFGVIYGEWRWLLAGRYGDLVYSTFDWKMAIPLYKLIAKNYIPFI